VRVSELGEQGLIELLTERLPRPVAETWIGDDAAVFPAPSERLVLTTDTMVEGIDFDLSYASGADVGWKALAVNVSDIAAMGAEPSKAVITVCLPPDTEVSFVDDMITGLVEAASGYGVDLVGGDISAASEITVGIALVGSGSNAPWLRSGARPGDSICVTGALGGSYTGLQALSADPGATGEAVRRHLRPDARLSEARALGGVGISAAIDVSDGLAIDLGRLLSASRAGCEIDSGGIPVDAAASATLEAALYGGEDFELLFTLPPSEVGEAASLVAGCGTVVTEIGRVTSGAPTLDGLPLDRHEERSWDHLRNR